ncbi:MAG: hypothetical protein U9R42_09620, partial [Bacteroidota bacterium]|nr:hypothetical protein [Bacteroidota bacterium]
KGNTIFIDGEYSTIAGGRHAVAFYLSGNYIQDKIESSEYIISKNKNYNLKLLTTENSEVFLFKKPKIKAFKIN